MPERDELAGFDDEAIEAVATEYDLTVERLRSIARTHQSNVRELPGVDDIVYEWRNYFHLDPLLAQTPAGYYLAVPDHVWEEFADDVGLDGPEREALVTLHDRQARRDAADVGVDTNRLEGDSALVLVRP